MTDYWRSRTALFTVVLCNDVASKGVVGDLLTRVWRIARGLHLAADDNIPRKQSNFCPHLYSAVYLPKVVKSEKVNLLSFFFQVPGIIYLSLPLTLQLAMSHLSTRTSSASLTPSVEAITSLSPRFQLDTSPSTWENNIMFLDRTEKENNLQPIRGYWDGKFCGQEALGGCNSFSFHLNPSWPSSFPNSGSQLCPWPRMFVVNHFFSFRWIANLRCWPWISSRPPASTAINFSPLSVL